jgi:hypothetical protein
MSVRNMILGQPSVRKRPLALRVVHLGWTRERERETLYVVQAHSLLTETKSPDGARAGPICYDALSTPFQLNALQFI